LQGSATVLRARRQGARVDPTVNGTRPPNVSAHALRAQAVYRLDALWPGAQLSAALVHEGQRTLLPAASSPTIGAWTRVDLGARMEQRLGDDIALTWQVGVDNVADRRAWKEAPYQFGHAYLFPLAPRTWRAGVQATF
jgi:iron complex outermembrane receptor protein